MKLNESMEVLLTVGECSHGILEGLHWLPWIQGNKKNIKADFSWIMMYLLLMNITKSMSPFMTLSQLISSRKTFDRRSSVLPGQRKQAGCLLKCAGRRRGAEGLKWCCCDWPHAHNLLNSRPSFSLRSAMKRYCLRLLDDLLIFWTDYTDGRLEWRDWLRAGNS